MSTLIPIDLNNLPKELNIGDRTKTDQLEIEQLRDSKDDEQQKDNLLSEISVSDSIHDFSNSAYDCISKCKICDWSFSTKNVSLFPKLNFTYILDSVLKNRTDDDLFIALQKDNNSLTSVWGKLAAIISKSKNPDRGNLELYYLNEATKLRKPKIYNLGKFSNTSNSNQFYNKIIEAFTDYKVSKSDISYRYDLLPLVIDVQKSLFKIMYSNYDSPYRDCHLAYVSNREMSFDAAGKINVNIKKNVSNTKNLHVFLDVDNRNITYSDSDFIKMGNLSLTFNNFNSQLKSGSAFKTSNTYGNKDKWKDAPWCILEWEGLPSKEQNESILNDKFNSKSSVLSEINRTVRIDSKSLLAIEKKLFRSICPEKDELDKSFGSPKGYSKVNLSKVLKLRNECINTDENKFLENYQLNIFKSFLRKRLGDQLQALSCLTTRKYKLLNISESEFTLYPKEYEGNKKFIFCSYDSIACAYAVLNDIPCIFETGKREIILFVPEAQSLDMANTGTILRGKKKSKKKKTKFRSRSRYTKKTIKMKGGASSTKLTNVSNSSIDLYSNRYLRTLAEQTLLRSKINYTDIDSDLKSLYDNFLNNPISLVKLLYHKDISGQRLRKIINKILISIYPLNSEGDINTSYNDDIGNYPFMSNSVNPIYITCFCKLDSFIGGFDPFLENKQNNYYIFYLDTLQIKFNKENLSFDVHYNEGGEGTNIDIKIDEIIGLYTGIIDKNEYLYNSLVQLTDTDMNGGVILKKKNKSKKNILQIDILITLLNKSDLLIKKNPVLFSKCCKLLLLKILSVYEIKVLLDDENYESRYMNNNINSAPINTEVYSLIFSIFNNNLDVQWETLLQHIYLLSSQSSKKQDLYYFRNLLNDFVEIFDIAFNRHDSFLLTIIDKLPKFKVERNTIEIIVQSQKLCKKIDNNLKQYKLSNGYFTNLYSNFSNSKELNLVSNKSLNKTFYKQKRSLKTSRPSYLNDYLGHTSKMFKSFTRLSGKKKRKSKLKRKVNLI